MQRWIPLLIATPFVLILDQVAKYRVVQTMAIGQSKVIIPALQPYFQFTRTSNTGIAFGLGEGGSLIFLILSSLVTIFLVYFYTQLKPEARLQQIAIAIVIGGALGNIIDRLRFGYVVDFFHIYIPGIISNVSNFADHAIVFGVALLILDSYRQEQEAKQESVEGENT